MRSGDSIARCLRLAALIVSAVALAGCSPIVKIERPGAVLTADYSLPYAITYANNARDAYQTAINQQVTTSNVLSSGLIGLGGIVAGLAAFGAHKDAIIGSALFGGTAYAIGNWNLNKQRLLVYNAGVEALNCSVRAVIPLYISAGDLDELTKALARLDIQSEVVSLALARARSLLNDLPANDPNRATAEQAIAASAARLDQARATLQSGRQFVTAARRAGPELVAAVDRVSAAVDKAVLDTLPDLTSLPKVVAGLAGLAGSISGVPGAGTAISKEVAAFGTKSQSGALGPTPMPAPLQGALNTLAVETGRLTDALAAVQARLAGYDTAASTTRLADCGVASVDTALKVTPARIELPASADVSAKLIASGGTKPYGGVLLNAPSDGLVLNTPLPFDSTFEIVAKKSIAVAGPFTVLITDASNPPKQVTVEIALTGAKTETPKATTGAGATNPQSAAGALEAIKKIGKIDVQGNTFTVVPGSSRVDGTSGDVIVSVSCTGSPNALANDLKVALYNAHADSDPAIGHARGMLTVTFTSDTAGCIQNTVSQSGKLASSGSAISIPPLPKAQLRTLQRSLCLSEADLQHGQWGNKSRGKLAEWRSARRAVGTGSLDSVTAAEFTTLFTLEPNEAAARCRR